MRDRARALIEEAIKNTDLDFQRGDGSDSLIGPGQQRLLKLITPVRPHEDAAILLGVSVSTAGFPEAIRTRSRGVVGVRNQGFEILGISESDFGEEDLGELIRDTIASITDRDEGG